jgi:Tol biopolymer transport system component
MSTDRGRRLPGPRLPGARSVQGFSFMPEAHRFLVIGNTRGAPQGLLIAGPGLRRPTILRRSTLTQITAVSPDGRRVAFDDSDNNSVTVMNVSTGVKRAVGQFPSAMDWSPDGRRLLYDSNGLFSVRFDGGDRRRVLDSRYHQASYSPSGRWLLAQRARGEDQLDLVRVRPDGSGARVIVSGRKLSIGGAPQAQWQPLPR